MLLHIIGFGFEGWALLDCTTKKGGVGGGGGQDMGLPGKYTGKLLWREWPLVKLLEINV